MKEKRFPWLKPAAIGVVVGVVGTCVIGFTQLGWVAESSAERMARDTAEDAVTAALTPVCVAEARRDPEFTSRLAELKDAATYQRSQTVMNFGWTNNRGVAQTCAEELRKIPNSQAMKT